MHFKLKSIQEFNKFQIRNLKTPITQLDGESETIIVLGILKNVMVKVEISLSTSAAYYILSPKWEGLPIVANYGKGRQKLLLDGRGQTNERIDFLS